MTKPKKSDPVLNGMIDDLRKDSDKLIKRIQNESDISKASIDPIESTTARTSEMLEVIDRTATVHLESFIKILNPNLLPLTVTIKDKSTFELSYDGCKPVKFEVGARRKPSKILDIEN